MDGWFLVAVIAGSLLLWLLASPFVMWSLHQRVARLEAARRASPDTAMMPRAERAPAAGPPEPVATGTKETHTPLAEAAAPAAVPPASRDPWSPAGDAAVPPQEDLAEPAAVADERGMAGSFETLVASRWMVWAGALALALGTVFLVRYSIERGLLGPEVRVLCGLGLGAGLSVAGEWLRRRPLLRPLAALRPEYIPAAVAGGGLASLFASLWAAHALYGMIGPLPAFVLLAAVAAATIALGLLHGGAFALFGALAAYAVPAMVGSPAPSPWSLFPYLAVLTGACLMLVRVRRWWWLGWLAVAAALGWTLAWLVSGHSWGGGGEVEGGFLVVLAATVVLARHDLMPAPRPADSLGAWLGDLFGREPFALASLAAIGGVMLLVAAKSDFSIPMLVAGIALVAALLALARRFEAIEAAAPLAAVLALALLGLWRLDLPSLADLAAEPLRLPHAVLDGPLVPEALEGFAAVAALVALLFAGFGWLAQGRARTPALWATLAAAMPLALAALVYATARGFESSIGWAALMFGLALVGLLAADRVQRRADPAMAGALGAYAVAVCAAIAFALAMALREAWLTVALAALLPALAWVHGRLRLAPLRWVAWLVAGTALVRLLANPAVLDYPLGTTPALGWMLYGYGLPLVFFLAAARWFGNRHDDPLVLVLRFGAAAFAVALQILETRLIMAGSFTATLGLAELSVHTLVWLLTALVLLRSAGRDGDAVLHWSGLLLLCAAGGAMAFGALAAKNPLFTGADIGALPLANLLALAYAAPAALLALHARLARRQADHRRATATGAGALLLAFVWLTLEIRHAFHGATFTDGAIGDGELYAYSVAWLGFGLALLAGGLISGRAALRYLSLAVVVAVTAKVFLWDMAGLTGIFRALSFLGLGVVLVGIGLAYQRFVFRRPGQETAPAP